ncbi:hypothetical protein VR45_06955, partial [Streptomyces sp. NRRL S-495]
TPAALPALPSAAPALPDGAVPVTPDGDRREGAPQPVGTGLGELAPPRPLGGTGLPGVPGGSGPGAQVSPVAAVAPVPVPAPAEARPAPRPMAELPAAPTPALPAALPIAPAGGGPESGERPVPAPAPD